MGVVPRKFGCVPCEKHNALCNVYVVHDKHSHAVHPSQHTLPGRFLMFKHQKAARQRMLGCKCNYRIGLPLCFPGLG